MRNKGVPGGLNPCLFQDKNEAALFVVPSLYQKGRVP